MDLAENDRGPSHKSSAESSRVGLEHRQFVAAVERVKPRVYSLIRRRITNRASAEDLLQETFLHAWRAWPTYDASNSQVAWFLKIAQNVVYDHLRKARAKNRDSVISLNQIQKEQDGRDAPSVEATAPIGLSPIDRFVLAEAIEELKNREQELLNLHQAGFVYLEIAKELGMTVSAVGPALTRIRKTLHQKLSSHISFSR